MKTIEEAAKHSFDMLSIAGADIEWIDFKGQFRIGVEFAQQWIGFEKELPPVMLEIIVKDSSGKKHKRVFTPLDNGDVKYLAETFTHWRPIELK